MSKSRQTWSKAIDFLFSALGYSIGLGNVWRFPYLCFKNGGGAYLVPYLFFAFLMAVPLLIQDIWLGQFSRSGLIQSWNIVPILKGIAIAQFVMQFHYSTFYAIIFTWATKYMVGSFSAVLPWSHCGNAWNTERCIAPGEANQSLDLWNSSVSAATEYWRNEVLGLSSGLEDLGHFRKDLLLYLFLLSFCFYLCTFKGIKWSAKVVYVTVTLPTILITVIVVRSATLDGATDGIKYYLVPDLNKLLKFETWKSACSQVVFSNGPGLGIWVLLGSYNKRSHNLWRDSFVVVLLNLFTSFTAGFAIFSTLGFMAKYQNTTIEQVASSGPGLAFIAYPQAISLLPFPQIWSFFFFLTLVLLGLDTQFVVMETLVTAITDNWRRAKDFRYGRETCQAFISVALFLLGLPMVTEGGAYVFEIYNQYAAVGWCWLLILASQCVGVAWFYGYDRFWVDLVGMIGKKRGKLWLKFSLKLFSPISCLVFSVVMMAGMKPLTYNDYVYPIWGNVIGHMISLSVAGCIPGYAVYAFVQARKSGKPLRGLIRCGPTDRTAGEKENGDPFLASEHDKPQLSAL